MDCSPQAPLSMGFPSKNTGVGCHFLLQGIFLIQGIKLESHALQADSLTLSQQGSRICNYKDTHITHSVSRKFLKISIVIGDSHIQIDKSAWRDLSIQCVCTKSLQLCLTVCDPMDCTPLGFSTHGIPQARYWSTLPFPPPGRDIGQ